MDLKEIKKLVTFAKRNGIKQIRNHDVEIVFGDCVSAPSIDDVEIPAAPQQLKSPTLADINEYIYGIAQTEEV